MSDSITNADLLQDNSFKKDLQSHRVNHGLTMTGNLKSAAIEKNCVVLEASRINLLKSIGYFEIIVDTG